MTDRPIIFSSPMVRALLAGRKTQTRRLATSPLRRVEVGDRLYVREGWRAGYGVDGYREDLGRCPKPREFPADSAVEYLADGARELGGPRYPSIHMPRWASRLTLIIEGVRVEPLQVISEADAEAEGITQLCAPDAKDGMRHFGVEVNDSVWPTASRAYRALWNSLHDDPHDWASNPDVVALAFRVVRANIDRSAA